jgi:hypothetical protein
MKVAVFLTAERAAAIALLQRVRARWPDAVLVAFANDVDRTAIAAAVPGVDVRRDKPAGGRLAFVRTLRGERFARVVVAWHGGDRFQPLRLASLWLGAPVLAIDERGRERAVRWWAPWTFLPHLVRRGVELDALALGRLAAACYRATVGLLVAIVWLPLRLRLERMRR